MNPSKLPKWAWAVAIIGGLAVGYLVLRHTSSSSTDQSSQPTTDTSGGDASTATDSSGGGGISDASSPLLSPVAPAIPTPSSLPPAVAPVTSAPLETITPVSGPTVPGIAPVPPSPTHDWGTVILPQLNFHLQPPPPLSLGNPPSPVSFTTAPMGGGVLVGRGPVVEG